MARMVSVRSSMLGAVCSHGVVRGRGVGGGEFEDDVGFGLRPFGEATGGVS